MFMSRIWEGKKRRFFLLLVMAVPAAYFLLGSTKPRERGDSPPAVPGSKRSEAAITPVVATRTQRGNIGVYLTGLGAVTPIHTVTVRSRVDGELMQVFYREGDMVHEKDLLAQVDPRPYEVQLHQAEAQLARDRASLENARTDLSRYETLLKDNATPEQQVATQRATVAQLDATVKADQAQVENATLNLVYCRITAPITGRVGLRLVDPGNIVHATDTNGLVVITQTQPMSVIFTIAEDQLPEVLRRLRKGQRLPVDAYDRDLKARIATGTLSTIDNQIDQTTGTVRLRAIFDNKNERLFPNEFVNAKLLVQEKRDVVLLNTAAIQRSQAQTYVYVVKSDSTVTLRPITIGTTEGDESEITSGVTPGEVIVMTGVDKLEEGSRVKVQIAEAPGATPARKDG